MTEPKTTPEVMEDLRAQYGADIPERFKHRGYSGLFRATVAITGSDREVKDIARRAPYEQKGRLILSVSVERRTAVVVTKDNLAITGLGQ